MHAIELEAVIDPQREIHLKLPQALPGDRARVIVLFEGAASSAEPRRFGLFSGQGEVADDFDAPLPDSFWTGEAA